MGWRTVFIAQTPILLLAAAACAMLIPSLPAFLPPDDNSDAVAGTTKVGATGDHRISTVLRHVDFGGALLLVSTITLGLLSMVFLGDGHTIHDTRVTLTLGLCIVSGMLLYLVERFIAPQPMLSRRLLSNSVVVRVYLTNVLGMVAQSLIHENPEVAYKEYKAHDANSNLLEELGFKVTLRC
ncbi:uncharacterized protein MYCFIDRAFT_80102 [Pseudocercospora fijiensis CIRAD86]|uniref:Major facilitator superfamily (MFS) profile domain-containing protein n=1 Tax=Pseudocercospora fijiensis (strain CIRAD86) TaxID=383855 RepID=N1Q7M6_PSEFD|nr:uncharacterized protein MYCFIDRAFT_80102 [Pseudocercospora fijiensis CIRAD86]EME88720.1 hypothetical protein MYCFIDRAFT_80102 [Pseudocercospora fijiensis CIRAD86]